MWVQGKLAKMVVVIFITRMPCPPTLYETFSPLLAVLP
jgi:hypothetical protein